MNNRHSFIRLNAIRVVAILTTLAGLLLLGQPGSAADRLRKSQLKDGNDVRAAFRDVVKHVNRSMVDVMSDGRQVSLGVIVSSDGLILTKASELSDHVRCRLRDGREFDATTATVHDRYDVALLKIECENLSPVEWPEGHDPQVGQWLATPGMEDAPVAVGIVSVQRRPIPPEKGVLGVQLSDGGPGARVTFVVPSSPASRAGLQTGDLIVRAGDQAIKDPQSFDRLIHKFAPGDTVNVVVMRDNHKLSMRAILGRPAGVQMSRGYWMNRMSGRMSQRRAGFPQAIQHDTVLEPEMCGGPVVNLAGQAVGLNIARAGRVETYAVPADVVRTLIRELRTSRGVPVERGSASEAATTEATPQESPATPSFTIPPAPTEQHPK
jgi:serine protease Do